jgi:hypothetical protein
VVDDLYPKYPRLKNRLNHYFIQVFSFSKLREGEFDLREGKFDLREGEFDLREGEFDLREGEFDLREGRARSRRALLKEHRPPGFHVGLS